VCKISAPEYTLSIDELKTKIDLIKAKTGRQSLKPTWITAPIL
jgi:hypothetical protein